MLKFNTINSQMVDTDLLKLESALRIFGSKIPKAVAAEKKKIEKSKQVEKQMAKLKQAKKTKSKQERKLETT